MVLAEQLTFGIEIECGLPVNEMRARNWSVGGYHSGNPIPNHNGWRIDADGSVRVPGMQSCEIVSPVLIGTDGLNQVRTMVGTLQEMGATVNRSCGFHVHVGWNGTDAQLRKLTHLVAFHEKALIASTGTTSRDNNYYCGSIRMSSAHREANHIDAVRTSRYHVLNLTNLSSKRTVEFRVFAGTVNATKIEAYIALCLGLVQKALKPGTKRSDWTPTMTPKYSTSNATRPGMTAMRRLLASMSWTTSGDRLPMGVLDITRLNAMRDQLRTMAAQYDRRLMGA